MFKLKNLISIVLFVCSLAVTNAVTFDEYPLGCYTMMKCGSGNNPCFADRDSILAIIRRMGYNLVQIENVDGDQTLSSMLVKLDSLRLSAIIDDKYYPWPDCPVPNEHYNPYSTSPLSTSSRLKLEAEYSGENDIDGGTNDSKWYCSHTEHSGNMPRVGLSTSDVEVTPSIPVWKCTRDSTNAGYAYTDVRWRWQNTYLTSQGYEPYKRLGDEFWVYSEHDSTNHDNKFIYIRYRLKLMNLTATLDATTPLLSFSTMGYRGLGTSDSTTVNHQFMDYNSNLLDGHTTDYCYGDFEQANCPTGYYDIEIKISYADMISAGLMAEVGWWRYVLVNLNPRLYWHGNCDLYLDYIDIEDQMHYDMTHDAATYASNINNRIDYLQNQGPMGIIKYLYSWDEPKFGQFDSYKTVQQYIYESNPNIITAAYDTHYMKIPKAGPNDEGYLYYDHVRSFRDGAQPRTILPNMYPVNESVSFNSDNSANPYALQTRIDDKVLRQYKNAKNYSKEAIPQRPFIPIVQTFGEWTDSAWTNWVLPPFETQKCLKYLPLCYGADGAIDYRAVSYFAEPTAIDPNPRHQYCSIMKSQGSLIYDSNFTRDAVTQANAKISVLGPLIKNSLKWKDAGRLNVGSEPSNMAVGTDAIVISAWGLSSLQVVPDMTDVPYQGYIQCGFYEDKADSDMHDFMLVNRRTNYSGNDLYVNDTPPSAYDTFYISAGPQSARFVINNVAHNRFGTCIALHDRYNDDLFRAEEDTIRVVIDAGECRLVEMVGTLPSAVSSDSSLSTKVILSGNITIGTGSAVSITAGTETTIKPGTNIIVEDGASFTLRGIVDIEDGVSIITAPNGTLNFDNATCTWGQGSKIEVTGGTLSINGGSMNASSPSRWSGLQADSSQVTINNASISGAFSNVITDSNCLITDSSITVPANSVGMILENSIPGYQTIIINTLPNRGFYGTTNLNTVGIGLGKMLNQANICNVDFQNLYSGIIKHAVPYAIDTVSECRFVNCATGIKLFNNENGTSIQQCSFANTQPGKQGTGIHLVASSPAIAASNFHNLYRGILSEFAIQSGFGLESSITESNFYNCEMGMESRSAYHCLKANYFNRNNSGIVNHAGSNLNLSFDANNVMMNRDSNIVFYDTMPYESTIQLFVGHNDFYHLEDNETLISAVDFSFDANYYDFPITPDFKIDASKNWFQDFQVTVNDHDYLEYVYVAAFDLSPSMPAPPPENDRLFIALDHESQELFEEAGATYKAIIDDQLDEEQTYVTSAIDGLYRCTMMIPNPDWELAEYFDTKAVQYAIDEPALSVILQDYLAKVFVLNKDFQAAVDLIQLRIDNPISEIDSLRAVLDLEIVLQLAAMEEDKRPLTTKYVQYQYPDFQVFDVMHSNNWDKYSRLLHQNDPETTSLIAPIPQIQSNYPNPFNPSTTIEFSIPATGRTRVSIYNIKGQKVKDLINSELARGNHKLIWDGNDAHNRHVASGIYLLRLESGGRTSIRKAMLMK